MNRLGARRVVVSGDGHPNEHGDVVGGDARVQSAGVTESDGDRLHEISDQALCVRSRAGARCRQSQERLRFGVREIAAVGDIDRKRLQRIRDIGDRSDVVAYRGHQVVENGHNEVVLVGEMPIEGGWADTGPVGDFMQTDVGAVCGERFSRRGDQPLPVALYILARRPHTTLLKLVALRPSYGRTCKGLQKSSSGPCMSLASVG